MPTNNNNNYHQRQQHPNNNSNNNNNNAKQQPNNDVPKVTAWGGGRGAGVPPNAADGGPWQQQQQQRPPPPPQPHPYGAPPPPHPYGHPYGAGQAAAGYGPPSSLQQQQQQYLRLQQQQQQQQQQRQRAAMQQPRPTPPLRPGAGYPPYAQQGPPPPPPPVPGAPKPAPYGTNYYSRHGEDGGGGGPRPAAVGLWQQNYPPGAAPGQGGHGTGTTTFYNNGAASKRKTLNITDRDGKPIDLTTSTSKTPAGGGAKASSSSASSLAAQTEAGAKLRAAAERNLKDNVNAREERERLERETKEKEERERLEKERRETEEKERLARERKERDEAERLECERLEAERLERERRERLERERLEERRLERERAEKAEKERLERMRVEEANKKRGGFRPGGSSGATGGLRPGSGGGSGLRPGGAGLRPGGKSRASAAGASDAGATGAGGGGGGGGGFVPSDKRITYEKTEILRLRDLPKCCERPPDLADMTISQNQGGGARERGPRRGGGGGGDPSWSRRDDRGRRGGDRRSDRRDGGGGGGGGGEWNRHQALPPARNNTEGRGGRGGGRGRGGRGDRRRGGDRRHHDLIDDGAPVVPLTRSDNRWVPQKNTEPLVALEKSIKSILNKMTKEKFQKLSNQMMEIPILSYEMLTIMIHRVYEKAIDEPSFGDMYADLCCRMAEATNAADYVHTVQSDEIKPDLKHLDPKKDAKEIARWNTHEVGAPTWRWSNDVATDDEKVVGPFADPDQCVDEAVRGEGTPIDRGDRTLELEFCRIVDGIFCKVLADREKSEYFVVYFAVEDAEKSEQQLSKKLFPTEETCRKDLAKENSFKRTLLNKCEDEFNKQDIYVEWKKEMKEYQETKNKLKESEIKEKDEEMEFRRMKIKKQMLGNIKFIGELYKKRMIREQIMHYCVQSLLKMEKDKKTGIIRDIDEEMDEEDHEALCQLFSTVGKELDDKQNAGNLRLYFEKIRQLSDDPSLSKRAQFMYKDLIDLRAKNWKERREKLQAKTIQEIHKDIAREERQKEQQQAQNNYRGGGGGGRDRHNDRDRGGDARRSYGGGGSRGGDRDRRSAPATDASGFTPVVRGRGNVQAAPVAPPRATKSASSTRPSSSKSSSRRSVKEPAPEPAAAAAPAPPPPLDEDKLKIRVKSIADEFVADPRNTAELLLSADELAGTPDAGRAFAQATIDRLVDCRATERPVLVTMLTTLFQANKLKRSDLESGFKDLIEFIDSYVCDSPNIVDHVGDAIAKCLRLGGVSVSWLCSACDALLRCVPDPKECTLHVDLVRRTVAGMKKDAGDEETRKVFLSEESTLARTLGGSNWSEIKKQLL